MVVNEVPLGDLCERVSVGHVGKTSEYYTDDTGVPFLRTQNVSSSGLSLDEVKYITPGFHASLKKSQLATGDVVLSRVISTQINCALIPPELEGANCANIILARPIKKKLDASYLLHYLRSDTAQRKLLGRQVGSAQSVVNTSVLKSWPIPLPPLAEQKRIAAILDKADALRRKRQQAIDLADQFLRSVFLEMFGDPVTNPKGWPTMPLKDLSRVVTGNTPSRKAPENYGSGIEWIKSDNINTPYHYLTEAEERLSDVGLEKGRSVPRGSVLVTCIAGSPQCIGNAAIADREVAFNQQINALVPRGKATTEYLYSLALFGKKLIQGASSNSMKGMVSKGNLENLVVPAPPKDLQNEYSNIFRELLRKRQRQVSSLDHFSSLFSSFNQQAFRGEL